MEGEDLQWDEWKEELSGKEADSLSGGEGGRGGGETWLGSATRCKYTSSLVLIAVVAALLLLLRPPFVLSSPTSDIRTHCLLWERVLLLSVLVGV